MNEKNMNRAIACIMWVYVKNILFYITILVTSYKFTVSNNQSFLPQCLKFVRTSKNAFHFLTGYFHYDYCVAKLDEKRFASRPHFFYWPAEALVPAVFSWNIIPSNLCFLIFACTKQTANKHDILFHSFCRSVAEFNRQVYEGNDRSAIYGTLVVYRNFPGILMLELSPAGEKFMN